MSYNTIVPLPNKSDNPSERVIKASENLDDIKKLVVDTIDMVIKDRTIGTAEKR